MNAADAIQFQCRWHSLQYFARAPAEQCTALGLHVIDYTRHRRIHRPIGLCTTQSVNVRLLRADILNTIKL